MILTSSLCVPLAINLAVIHNGDMIGEFLGFFHIVGGVEHRHPLLVEFLDALEDIAAALRIDAHGGFIHDDHIGFVEQGDTDVQAAFHPAGKFGQRGLSGGHSAR